MGIFDIFSSRDDEEAARRAAALRSAGYSTGRDAAYGALDTGYDTASGLYGQARVPFSDLLQKGTKLYDQFMDAYGDATGINGAEGSARARAAFTSLPGYQEGIGMAIDQNDRRAAARGMLGSGNVIADTTRLATDYASQKYSDYLSSLLPGVSSGQSVMGSGATGVGNLLSEQARLAGTVGSSKAGYGYQSATGAAGAEAQGVLDEQQARENASAQFWNALGGAASLGVRAFGGGGMFSPGGAFGGYQSNNPWMPGSSNRIRIAGLDF